MHVSFTKIFSIVALAVSVLPVPTYQLTIHRDALTSRDVVEEFDTITRNDTSQNHAYGAAATPFSQDLIVANGYWLGTLILGNGGEIVDGVIFDTGSDVLWVSEGVYSPGPAVKPGPQETIKYANTAVTGTVYDDSFNLQGVGSNVKAIQQNFLIGAPPAPMLALRLTGTLGMSLDRIPTETATILDLVFQNFLDQNYASPNKKFTFYPSGSTVALTVGGDNSKVSLNGIVHLPVIAGPYWSVALSSITAGASGRNIVKSTEVLFDTGLTYIVGPQAEVQDLFSTVQGAQPDTTPGRWTVKCGTFPNLFIIFTAAPNQAFTINGKDLETPLSPTSSTCSVRILAGSKSVNEWRFGTPFLNTVYSQFNVGTLVSGKPQGYTVGLQSLAAVNTASSSSSSSGGNGNSNNGGSSSSSGNGGTGLPPASGGGPSNTNPPGGNSGCCPGTCCIVQ